MSHHPTQREIEYYDYRAFMACCGPADVPKTEGAFDLLWWLHSGERASWHKEKERHLSRHHVDEAVGGAHDKPSRCPCGDETCEGYHPPLGTPTRPTVSAEVVERKKQVIESLAKPKLRHYTSAERKGMPIHTGVMLYFPDALAAISRLSKAGNDKHNPGEPLHWARGKSKDHSDCQARHMLTPDEIDPETGETERVAAAWRALADLQLAEEKRLVAAGILPLSGVIE